MFYFTCDRSFSVVVSTLALFNEVNRLLLGWVTVYTQVNHHGYMANHLGRLSLLLSVGR